MNRILTLLVYAILILFIVAVGVALIASLMMALAPLVSAGCAVGWPDCPADTVTPAWAFLPGVMR